jgi:lipopolysaccharide/colanic/teichoic acid biosynthesis glycosyltransferase
VSTINLGPFESPLLGDSRVARAFSLPDTVERAAGLLLLAAAAPVIATSAIAVAALSRRSPFIAHLRVARRGKPFWMLKLRTMWPKAGPASAGYAWIERIAAAPDDAGKDPCDPRVSSWFASFCRRHSVDELPQLWHVACGEMSLVGPRPLTRAEIERHYAEDATELLSVKPGLTGLWQIYGRSAIRFPRRAAMDLELVRNLSVKTRLKILARTIPAIVFGNGAW